MLTSFRQKAKIHIPVLPNSLIRLSEGALGGIVVRGRTPEPPVFEVDFWPPREGVISRGLFFGSPRPYGMWHENAISHPPRSWEQSAGRLRLLRSATDLNDVITEVPPVAGTLLAFKRSDNSWHGHEPFGGERRVSSNGSRENNYGTTLPPLGALRHRPGRGCDAGPPL